MNLIKILVADDQTLMRDGLKTILDLEDDMEVVGTAENGLLAYGMTGELRPDIVLMDIRMPEMDGVESTRLIKRDYPQTIVIMLTTFNEEDYIIQALNFGASGYLLKDMPANKLIEAIREGVTGNMLMPSNVATKLVDRLTRLSAAGMEYGREIITAFSERELEIIRLLVQGYTNKQLASQLYITEGTAKNYISMIYSKIGINDRVKAIAYFKEHA